MTTRTLVDTDSVQIVANKWLDDVRQYQQNVDTLWKHGTINAALANIGTATHTTLVVTENTAVNANTDLTSYPNIHWLFLGSGKLTPATGVTLTLYSPDTIKADPTQFILDATSGTIAFAQAGTVYAKWFGMSTSATASANKTYLQTCITATPSYSTVVIDGGTYLLSGGVQISSKTNYTIRGNATLTLNGAASDSYIFEKVGTISRLKIADLTLKGENNAAYTQEAIGCASGQTISDSTFENLVIQEINVGISCNANLSGSYTKSTIRNNRLSTIIGTSSGQGYGIHLANATDTDVFGNSIDTAHRHAIYQAKGGNGVRILNNIIRNHRSGVATAGFTAAIVVSRSSRVTVADNFNIDGYDGGLELSHVTADSATTEGVIVAGNQFINRKNATPDLYVGEQAVPGTYVSQKILINGNHFYNDYANTGSGNPDISILNGLHITITNNQHRCIGVTGNRPFVVIGSNSYISASDDCHMTVTKNNEFIAEGSGLTLTAGVNVCSDVATLAGSVHWIGQNVCTGIAAPVLFDAAVTNGSIYYSQNGTIPIFLRANLPAASASLDGLVVIDDNGTGDRNLVVYAGGQRFRIDGGANV